MNLDLFQAPPPPKPKAVDLFALERPYQRAANEALISGWKESRSLMAVLATGCGKTIIAAGAVKRLTGNVLFMAHRRELIYQTKESFETFLGEPVEVEMGDLRASGNTRIIVASKDSLYADRLQRLENKGWKPVLLIVDEAHHCSATNESYAHILRRWSDAKVLGLTATPDRADECRLLDNFDEVACVYELDDAIRDGWLVPVRSHLCKIDSVDLSALKSSNGDFHQAELNTLMAREEVTHQMVRATIEHGHGLKAVVFCTSIDNSHLMAEVFNHYEPGSAAAIDQSTPDDERKKLLAAHRAGDIRRLCNVNILTEGYDDPTCALMVNAAPTKSRARYAQRAGRVTRPLKGILAPDSTPEERRAAIAASAKPWCLWLDLVGSSTVHRAKLPMGPEDILGGKSPEEVIKKAKEIAEKEGGGDPMALIDRAQRELEKAKRQELRSRLKVQVQVKSRVIEIDPFAMYGIEDSESQWGGAQRFGWKPPTDKMTNALRNYGIESAEMSFKEARTLLDKIIGENRPTVKMILAGEKAGFDARDPRWTFDKVKKALDTWSKQGWKKLTPGQAMAILYREPGSDDQ